MADESISLPWVGTEMNEPKTHRRCVWKHIYEEVLTNNIYNEHIYLIKGTYRVKMQLLVVLILQCSTPNGWCQSPAV